ncbi:hypothetical protein M422DRAFT_37195 [Sphaerobolus stellatus SS14]|uniref:Unplaced genomic scaffold SPHSTscaffold_221, whole genome shotgun sequence n=1 Tax=Sphaerobolus stellatus (strain SS14) TaxID=990650 RepID=A0A0C9UU65_SPHS4|nr:hypothetical protein M422DRAFT_37195 [Sphaerobolus stellatus SS14]
MRPGFNSLLAIWKSRNVITNVRKRNAWGLQLGEFEYRGVGNVSSRFNHSCAPNVSFQFDPPTLSFQTRAVRNIHQGEELFVAYEDLIGTKAERQGRLHPWGFICACPTCQNATAISDRFRKRLPDVVKQLLTEHARWLEGSSQPSSSIMGKLSKLLRKWIPSASNSSNIPAHISEALRCYEMMLHEGMEITSQFGQILIILTEYYLTKLDTPNLMKYLPVVERYYRMKDIPLPPHYERWRETVKKYEQLYKAHYSAKPSQKRYRGGNNHS